MHIACVSDHLYILEVYDNSITQFKGQERDMILWGNGYFILKCPTASKHYEM